MPEAVALGELLVDFVSTEIDVGLAELPGFAGAAGGAPANVAVGLARMGVTAGFIGKVGADPFGDFLRRTLLSAEVDVTHLRATEDARTTLAFVATRSDGRKDICFYRHPGADSQLTSAELEVSYLRSARLFHFGSVSLSASPAREATLAAAQEARGSGLLVSYDPNWRPGLWEGQENARATVQAALPLAHVVHCAEEEWEFVAGTADLAEGAKGLLALGPELVVVTRGEMGCYFDNGEARGSVDGFAVQVVDPLGAGDAFVAALLSRLIGLGPPGKLNGPELAEIMRFANAAGALTCTKRGVIPSLPTAQQVAAFMEARGEGG
jgi:fructokinase